MNGPELQLLLTDALLLDAVEGVDAIASRLVDLYDRWNAGVRDDNDVPLLAQVLTDLGWWSGRLQGAVSSATTDELDRLVSGGA